MQKKPEKTSSSKTSPTIKHTKHATAPHDAHHGPRGPFLEALSLDNVDKVITLCLVAVFLALFIFLLITGRDFYAYLTLCTLLTLVFVGILRATGLIRTSWLMLGGSAAVFAGLFWLTRAQFDKYMDGKLENLENTIATLRGANDSAASTLYKYFGFLQDRRFPEAYALVSEARKKEKKEEVAPEDDFENFKTSFEHTYGFDNVVVLSIGGNKYTVSYDVTDNVPRNELYDRWRGQLFSSPSADEILKRDAVVNALIVNLEQHYIIPNEDKMIGEIKSYTSSRKIDDLFGPIFVDLLARNLRDRSKLEMKKRDMPPGNVQVRRHFLHTLTMVQENEAWKIRQGLSTPVIANYP
jgi:hypothetical protein